MSRQLDSHTWTTPGRYHVRNHTAKKALKMKAINLGPERQARFQHDWANSSVQDCISSKTCQRRCSFYCIPEAVGNHPQQNSKILSAPILETLLFGKFGHETNRDLSQTCNVRFNININTLNINWQLVRKLYSCHHPTKAKHAPTH